MFNTRRLLVAALTLVWAASALAQNINGNVIPPSSSTNNTSTINYTAIPGLVADWNSVTGTGTDNCNAISAAIASGSPGRLYIPPHTYLNCQITLRTGVELVGHAAQTYLITSGFDASATADVILGPSGAFFSGDINSGWPSGMDGLLIVRSNWHKAADRRDAYTVARAFAGTALTIRTPNFHGSNLTFIGFNIPILNIETSNAGGVNADQTILENIYGDNTNGITFASTNPGVTACCGDIPHIKTVHMWPTTSYNPAFGPSESTEVTNVTNSAGLFLVTLAAPPATTAYLTGDIIEMGPIDGMPTINKQWIITVIDSTHFTLNGSTFAGTYNASVGGTCATRSPGCNLSYFNAAIRTGRGLSIEDANTAINIIDYFVQSFNTSFYYGHGSFTVTCTDCYSEMQPEGAVDMTSIGIDIESNADNIAHIGGQIVTGTALKVNTTNPHAVNLTGVGLFGLGKVTDIISGNVNFTGGTIAGGVAWPPNSVAATIDVGTNGRLCVVGAQVFGGYVGSRVSYRCGTSNGIIVLHGTTDGAGNATIPITPSPAELVRRGVSAGFAVAASPVPETAMIIGPSADAGQLHVDDVNAYIIGSPQVNAPVRVWIQYDDFNDDNWPQ